MIHISDEETINLFYKLKRRLGLRSNPEVVRFLLRRYFDEEGL